VRILVAEDEPAIRRLLEVSLRKWGYEPLATQNGQEALNALCEEGAPRLALLDWMMPEMEGLEVVRQVRATETQKDDPNPVYFILLTARGHQEDVVQGFEAGVDDYVTKPFNGEELHARVQVGARVVDLRESLRQRVEELEQAVNRVNTLQGLLPICSFCKKIRDDQNYWTEVESYVSKASGAEFSHGVCPDCYDKHISPDLESLKNS
jgi:DNA-binding response OmpR family regulator